VLSFDGSSLAGVMTDFNKVLSFRTSNLFYNATVSSGSITAKNLQVGCQLCTVSTVNKKHQKNVERKNTKQTLPQRTTTTTTTICEEGL